MKVLGLVWVGTRTLAFEETVHFFHSVMGLPIGNSRPHFTRLDLPDAGSIEVFDAAIDQYTHFSTGPVPGFVVADFDDARTELERAGCELLLPEGGDLGDYRWQHFRGPDGFVYEIVDYPERPVAREPSGAMGVTKVIWLGLSTSEFGATSSFLKGTLNLAQVEDTSELIECSLPDGGAVEAFRRGGKMDHPHFRTGPVPGFGVANVALAEQLLRTEGVPILMSRRREWGGWAHLRAPDGFVYEVKEVSRLGQRV